MHALEPVRTRMSSKGKENELHPNLPLLRQLKDAVPRERDPPSLNTNIVSTPSRPKGPFPHPTTSAERWSAMTTTIPSTGPLPHGKYGEHSKDGEDTRAHLQDERAPVSPGQASIGPVTTLSIYQVFCHKGCSAF